LVSHGQPFAFPGKLKNKQQETRGKKGYAKILQPVKPGDLMQRPERDLKGIKE